jgi:hypothetical protein
MPNKMNVIQGLKALVNMGVDLRAYWREVKIGEVNLPDGLDGIHDIIMNACRELSEAGEGEDAASVLWYYIDRATAF